MLSKIGFTVDNGEERTEIQNVNQERTIVPRKSVVEVYFPDRQMTLSFRHSKTDRLKPRFVKVNATCLGLKICCGHYLQLF